MKTIILSCAFALSLGLASADTYELFCSIRSSSGEPIKETKTLSIPEDNQSITLTTNLEGLGEVTLKGDGYISMAEDEDGLSTVGITVTLKAPEKNLMFSDADGMQELILPGHYGSLARSSNTIYIGDQIYDWGCGISRNQDELEPSTN